MKQLPLISEQIQPQKRVNPSYKKYEEFSKTRLSKHFLMRDFLHCNVNSLAGICNYPDDVEHVIKSGKALCSMLLEPILEHFGPVGITYGYQNAAGMNTDPGWAKDPKGSSPHNWDRFSKGHGNGLYARVDVWPWCVEDGEVSKEEFGRWCMMNLDIDIFMMWEKANIFCITVAQKPRRVWLTWVKQGTGDGGGNRITHMGEKFWQVEFPKLKKEDRPKFYPSLSDGRMWLPK